MVAPQYTYRDWMKVVVKHDHQNQAINIEIANNQYIYSGTRSTHGEREILQGVQIKSIDWKMLSCVDWANNPENKKDLIKFVCSNLQKSEVEIYLRLLWYQ